MVKNSPPLLRSVPPILCGTAVVGVSLAVNLVFNLTFREIGDIDRRRDLLQQLELTDDASTHCSIDIIDATTAGAEKLFEDHYYLQKPVLVRNLESTPNEFLHLADYFGDQQVTLGTSAQFAFNGRGSSPRHTLGAFMSNLSAEASAGKFVFSRGTIKKEYMDRLWQNESFVRLMQSAVPGWSVFDSQRGLSRWRMDRDECSESSCRAVLGLGGVLL